MSGVSLAPGLRRITPELLVGGTPARLLRLTTGGGAALDALLAGRPHPDARRLQARLIKVGALLAEAAPGPVDDVTVVIPFGGEPAALRRTLAGVPGGVACIVVDDSGGEPLELPGVTVVRTAGRLGPAAARNRGAALVTTGLIAFLDTDLTLPGGWLAGLTGHFADPGVIAVAPRIVSARGAGAAGVVEQRFCALDLGTVPAVLRPDSAVSYLPSTAIVIGRRAYEAVGGFDEALAVGEDVDLSWRLAEVGQVRFDPGIVIEHEPRRRLGAALRRRVDYGSSAGALDARHPGRVRHLELDRWSTAAVLAALVHPLLGAGVAGVAVASAPRRLPQLPPALARRLVREGLGQAARGMGRYAVRPGLPLTLGVMVLHPRARRGWPLLVAAHLASARPRLAGASPAALPVRLVLHLAEDVAYSLGVWQGALRHRRLSVVLPRLGG